MKRCHQLGDCPGATHTGRELDKELCTGLVDLVHKFLEILEHLFVLPEPLAPEGVTQRGDTGDDQTDVVVGSFQEELGRFLVKVASRQLKPAKEGSATHGAHDNAVFDLNVTNFPRCKECFVFCICFVHRNASFQFVETISQGIVNYYLLYHKKVKSSRKKDGKPSFFILRW